MRLVRTYLDNAITVELDVPKIDVCTQVIVTDHLRSNRVSGPAYGSVFVRDVCVSADGSVKPFWEGRFVANEDIPVGRQLYDDECTLARQAANFERKYSNQHPRQQPLRYDAYEMPGTPWVAAEGERLDGSVFCYWTDRIVVLVEQSPRGWYVEVTDTKRGRGSNDVFPHVQDAVAFAMRLTARNLKEQNRG
jgi:hypothetical protein